jgi:hypothetical protein
MDLGGGDILSEGQRQLIRRCAMLSVKAEEMECAAADGRAFDIERYVILVNALGRAFERIGIERKPRNITPDLKSYIAAKNGNGAARAVRQ